MILPSDAILARLELDTYAVAPAGEVYSSGIDRAVITRRADCTIVSVMGTETPAQWISDFKAAGVKSASHPLIGVCESGFLAGALSLWEVLRDRRGTLPLLIQGHSRGAGMVPILAALALLDGIKAVRCVGWETPWCVGSQCRDLLLSAGIAGLQYWHGDDPVPCVPAVPWLVPNVWPIVHFGQWALDPLDCHLMAGVVAGIEAGGRESDPNTGIDRGTPGIPVRPICR